MQLDHLVYGVPDLLDGVRDFARLTGLDPRPGGRHLDFGTANWLLGLGPGCYFEIIGPDPEAPGFTGPRLFDINTLAAPTLLTWAVRSADIDADIATARAAGYDPGDEREMSRRTADGELLSWRLTPSSGVLPFLIDWGATPHPSVALGGAARLEELVIEHPDPSEVRRQLAALGLATEVREAARSGVRAVIATPLGPIGFG